MPEMEYFLASEQGGSASLVFHGFTALLRDLLKAGWRVSPGTYHSVTSKEPPTWSSGDVIKKDEYTPVFMICVQVEREKKVTG
jgi:hypothetical protein